MLGEFEYLILSTAAGLGEEAYGAAIRKDVERLAGRRCSAGALYTTLDRLQEKGLIETWMGEATPRRGGRAKRMVRLTDRGTREAANFYRSVLDVTRGLSWDAQVKGRA